jgi:hypothetical protein
MDIDHLKHEVSRAMKAKAAYEGYLKEKFASHFDAIYNRFAVCVMDDDVIESKREHTALKMVENEILQDIETGRMAQNQLDNLSRN